MSQRIPVSRRFTREATGIADDYPAGISGNLRTSQNQHKHWRAREDSNLQPSDPKSDALSN